ncbi:MAG TPA: hypothetical protein P5268_02235 [Candidatus Marinimicrobia bacterium]|nr:hypothetical protein [Candidatus Neomarinimicrobiota bacterium]HRS50824.1 hypothetical protein [Candidatus Neomarinimicrobiota bacterium]HRU91835.1 hypothetical protein [Candidatus Neomarinimicrobiota bacterium]
MKTQTLCVILMVFTIMANSSVAQLAGKKTATTDQFFEVDKSIEELRQEIAQIRQQIHDIELRTSTPEIRKEINRLVPIPDITHEIILHNGTVVQGKIIHETIDKIVIQTNIGQLTISKNDISISRQAEKPHAKCVLVGPITPKIFEDKTIYTGKIKNEGERRADFPQIRIQLFDEATNLIAADSIIIAGNYHMFLSGVQTDATIEPGQTCDFEITISYPAKSKVSYFIPKITWQEFD